jgi:large subunit ribosomal protein L10
MPTPQKEETVAQVAEALRGAQAAILTDYRGLTVSQVSDLRKKLRESGADFAVVKNTLFKRATDGVIPADPQLDEILNGPTAVAFANQDPVAAAKVIANYIRDNRNTPLAVKGGVVGGKFFTAAQVEQLSKVPPREVLFAQLIGSLQSPVTNLVGTLNGIVANLAYTLQAVADKKQADAAS